MSDVVIIPLAELSDPKRHIPNLWLNRETRKTYTGLWNNVFISHTTQVITISGLTGRHVVSGVGQYRLTLVCVAFLSVNSAIASRPRSSM
jgi:hypothetical protein